MGHRLQRLQPEGDSVPLLWYLKSATEAVEGWLGTTHDFRLGAYRTAALKDVRLPPGDVFVELLLAEARSGRR